MSGGGVGFGPNDPHGRGRPALRRGRAGTDALADLRALRTAVAQEVTDLRDQASARRERGDREAAAHLDESADRLEAALEDAGARIETRDG